MFMTVVTFLGLMLLAAVCVVVLLGMLDQANKGNWLGWWLWSGDWFHLLALCLQCLVEVGWELVKAVVEVWRK